MSRSRGLNLRLLRRMAQTLAEEISPDAPFTVDVHYVDSDQITELNEQFLQHAGSTDVISFDYRPDAPQGEIFICYDEAIAQAGRFRTTPALEIVRYLVHGFLHLQGYDDSSAVHRKRMKRAEDLLLARMVAEFPCEEVWSKKPPA